VALIYATLDTLHGFLNWIPVGYIFEENLLDLIVEKVGYFLIIYQCI